jgi:hypothetical protein
MRLTKEYRDHNTADNDSMLDADSLCDTRSTNLKQELPVAAMFVNGSKNEMSNLYRGPSIVASYQVSYHLAK